MGPAVAGPPELLTVAEAAVYLGLRPAAVRHLIARGSLPAYPTALDRRQRLLRRRDVDAMGRPTAPGVVADWSGGVSPRRVEVAGGG